MIEEAQLLLRSASSGWVHIEDPFTPGHVFCGRPLVGNGQFGHPWKLDLAPAPWLGDPAGPRQRTVADQRAQAGHIIGLCERCRTKAGLR